MIQKIKYHQPHKRKLIKKSPIANLKKTCGTWFFTPRLVRADTSMIESSWNLKFEPNNIRSDPNKITSDPNKFISDLKVWNEIKSPTTILKETCGTWFVTPKLMKPATSSTERSWNWNVEPINIR